MKDPTVLSTWGRAHLWSDILWHTIYWMVLRVLTLYQNLLNRALYLTHKQQTKYIMIQVWSQKIDMYTTGSCTIITVMDMKDKVGSCEGSTHIIYHDSPIKMVYNKNTNVNGIIIVIHIILKLCTMINIMIIELNIEPNKREIERNV